MSRVLRQVVIIAPMVVAPVVQAAEPVAPSGPSASVEPLPFMLLAAADPFALDAAELDPIRFSRVPDPDIAPDAPPRSFALGDEHRTEVSFQLRPQRPDFSRAGLYGLNMIGRPRIAVHHVDLHADLPGLNDGFAYSAGVRIEHEEAAIDGTAYVSSSLLGLSYGRLGRLWYGGIDVNVERFRDAQGVSDASEVVSLDVTTGRRLGITGLGADSPLWLLSVHGNMDLEPTAELQEEVEANWFLNPQLFWQHPGFTFSAGMQLPVAPVLDDDEDDPDYRLRAVFEKRFR